MFIYKQKKSNTERHTLENYELTWTLYNKSKHPIIEENKKQNKKIEGINNTAPFRRNGTKPKCDRLVMRQSETKRYQKLHFI